MQGNKGIEVKNVEIEGVFKQGIDMKKYYHLFVVENKQVYLVGVRSVASNDVFMKNNADSVADYVATLSIKFL